MFYRLTFNSTNKKFVKDLNWNIAAFAGSAICGLIINILLVRIYNYEILGSFNLLLACFLVISQIASLGIHLSIQKFVPQNSHHKDLIGRHLAVVLCLSLFISIPVSILALILSKFPGLILENEIVEKGFKYCIPGICFFVINKIILAYLNGKRFMKSFAFFSFLRPLLMLGLVVIFILIKPGFQKLAFIFSLPEFFLSVLLFLEIRKDLKIWKRNSFFKILKFHFDHGSRVAISNILISLNSKTDILILGLFSSGASVGIYSFAIFFIDGFAQLINVFRQNINPVITRVYFNYNSNMLSRLLKNWTRSFYKIFLLIGILIGIFYPFIVLFTDKLLMDNFFIFYGLLIGMLLSSGFLPYQYIFNQLGLVLTQSKFFGLVFILNVIVNFSLVPLLGVYGSVLSFFIINLFQMQYLKKFIRKIQPIDEL